MGRSLTELLGETLAVRLGGAHTLAEVASVTLVGSSAGGPAIATLLDDDDLHGRIHNVVLSDSLYGSESTFARWLRGAPDRRLVCIHGGMRYTSPHAAMLRPAPGDQVVVEPRGAMTEAIRTHRAVFAMVYCEHIGMGIAYLDKVLMGLDLPRRAPDPKTPVDPAPAPAAVVTTGSAKRVGTPCA